MDAQCCKLQPALNARRGCVLIIVVYEALWLCEEEQTLGLGLPAKSPAAKLRPAPTSSPQTLCPLAYG